MLASGFAGLGYQIVWTQQSSVWLGHENAAVLAVVAAFFGGLALGAWLLGDAIERSARPASWYVACELLIVAWGLFLAWAIAPYGHLMLQWTGVQPSAVWQWTVAFLGTGLLLLPATMAMGATLPAMQRMLAASHDNATAKDLAERDDNAAAKSMAGLYACNTLGAVGGVLAMAFVLVPAWGLMRSAWLCAGLNLLCAVLAWWLWRGRESAVLLTAAALRKPSSRSALWRLAATGFLGIGYEVLVVRVLSQVSENTVYTFALLLAVYLVGTALGAAAYQRWGVTGEDTQAATDSAGPSDRTTDRLLAFLAAACLLGMGGLWIADEVKAQALQWSDGGMATALASEALLAALAFGLPTLAMGALFSHLCAQARAGGFGFGRALAVNTAGAAAAPLLIGVMWVPVAGTKAALLCVVMGYLLLMPRRQWRSLRAVAPGAALAAVVATVAIATPPLRFVDVPPGGQVLSYEEGANAAVSVVEDASGVARLHINNRQQEGSSASQWADGRQALLPLLLHPAPKRALFLGLGTGVTVSAAALDSSVQVDAVELLPEVIQTSRFFNSANPRLNTVVADARRFVRVSPQTYDVIVADNFHPARSGSGALYTVEHFQAVQARLATGGVFCQWLPLHQLDLPTLRSIVQTFMAVYPQGLAVLASNSLQTPVLGLLAGSDAQRWQLPIVRARLSQPLGTSQPSDYGFEDEWALLGSVVAGPAALARFAGKAALNTDDRPVVAYSAPRITYSPTSSPAHRLNLLMQELSFVPAEVLAASSTAADTQRLLAYTQARRLYLQTGLGVHASADVRVMLAQLQTPLLAVLRTSPDFRPAYYPLLRMAQALEAQDPAAAQALLGSLAQLQAAKPKAENALELTPQ